MPELLRYSEVDSLRFGKRIYRAQVANAGEVSAIDERARTERVDMVIARCAVGRLDVVHALEVSGHRLMDTLVYYGGLTQAFDGVTWQHAIRPATAADRDGLAVVASDAFTNYDGHYHADPRLDPRLATLGYVEWCTSLLDKAGHTTWIAEEGSTLMGFIAIRHDQPAAEIVLNGVASRFQRRGVYDSLLKAAGQSLLRSGKQEIVVSTHLGNLAPQKVWAKNGMSMSSALYTFHKWYSE
jgi:hypothetical protein